MTAELEKWINQNQFDAYGTDHCGEPSGFQTEAVPVSDLRTLFDGKVLVPGEPTFAMLEAARDWSYKKYDKPIGNDAAQGCWKAMLAASQEQGK